MAIAISVLIFLAVTGLITPFGYRRYVVAGRAYDGLASAPGPGPVAGRNPEFFSIRKLAITAAQKMPASAETESALRKSLLMAGYRDQKATALMYGLKLLSVLAIGLLMALFELRSDSSTMVRLVGVAVGVLAGFRVPNYILAKKIKARQKALRSALPDALDLIIVCVEAGLTIDRAFRNVTHHLALVHPALSDELSLVTAEIAAGLRRKEALENMASRTDEKEIRKFVAVVMQADRFGTSMADALRTHSEYLRVRRRQEAEEKASKVSVKMIFPIFFFIMPCMMLVTVGPAVIVIMREFLPAISGH